MEKLLSRNYIKKGDDIYVIHYKQSKLEPKHTHEFIEIVYIIDGDFYDADAIYFVITSVDRDSEKYDGDYYFEFDDMYVDSSLQLDTLARVGASHAWVTNEFEHDGLHGERVFKHLLDEARDCGDLAGVL